MQILDKVTYTGSEFKPHHNFWKEQLAQFHEGVHFTTLRQTRKNVNANILTQQVPLSPEVAALPVQLVKGNNTGLLVCVLTATAVLLEKYTRQPHVVIDSPLFNTGSNNPGPVKRVPLLLNIDRSSTLRATLNAVQGAVKNCYKYQDYPTQLLDEQAEGNVFPTNVLVRFGEIHHDLEDLDAYDLLIDLHHDAEDGLQLLITYRSNAFENWFIEQMGQHLSQVLGSFANLDTPLAQIDVLPANDRQALEQGIGVEQKPAQQSNLLRWFEQTAQAQANEPALVCGTTTLTYRQVNEQANGLAHYLINTYGVKPGAIVGLLTRRSEKPIVAMLAILKTGAAYLPMDAEHPAERIQFMLTDAGVEVLVTENDFVPRLSSYEGKIVALDAQPEALTPKAETPAVTIAPEHLFYIIYTSGSTGTPKGVKLPHSALANYFNWFVNRFEIGPNDKSLLFASVAFDLGYTSLWGTLLAGGTLFVLEDSQHLDPETLNTALLEHKVTYIKLTPSHFSLIVNGLDFEQEVVNHALKLVLLGGEEIRTQDLDRYLTYRSNLRFVNHYGPTEATIGTIYHEIDNERFQEYKRLPVIGQPVWNQKVFILDSTGQLVPKGIPGEICVSGPSLAQGYLNRQELTQERFVESPFEKGQFLYRTGDKGRWVENDTIEFLGRLDTQVKIRGYRVELGEIEAVLTNQPDVEDVVVVARKDDEDMNQLVAYFTGDKTLTTERFGQYLEGRLPEYMIPGYFVWLENIPLTPNGKVDRKKLPSPSERLLSSGQNYVAPRNDLEEQLVAIWENALAREDIGVYDNFFEIGGHSLRATQVLNKIHRELDVKLKLNAIFASPTVDALAKSIENAGKSIYEDIVPVPEAPHYPVSHAQKRMWILDQLEDDKIAYNIIGGYEFRGKVDINAYQQAFELLIERHEVLRTVFKIVDGDPVQVVLPTAQSGFKINYVDLRKEADPYASAQQLAGQEAASSFDLENGPLLRITFFQLAEEHFVFYYSMHHIVGDGSSMQVMTAEVIALYDAVVNKTEPNLPPLEIQYKDYAAWQNRLLHENSSFDLREYWLQQFDHPVEAIDLPYDFPRPPVKTFKGAHEQNVLPEDLRLRINEIAQDRGASVFMVLMSALYSFLYRITGQTDMVVGSPIAGREHEALKNQIGFYLNTLPLRAKVDGRENFYGLLEQVRQTAVNAFENQAYPFDKLVEELDLDRDLSRSPMFDVMLHLLNTEQQHAGGESDIEVQWFNSSSNISKFDLTFSFMESAGMGMVMVIEYNTDLFKPETAQRLYQQFHNWLDAVTAGPTLPLRQVQWLPQADQDQILNEFNNTGKEYPKDKTIVELFEAQVAKQPQHPAISHHGTVYTYEQLNQQANQLAHHLLQNVGLEKGQVVGVCVPKGIDHVTAVLAVQKAGGAYVPFDPELPNFRIQYAMENAQGVALITHDNEVAAKAVEELELTRVNLHELPTGLANTNPPVVTTPQDTAYIMYTSGSTGLPKGVIMPIQPVVRLASSLGINQVDNTVKYLSTSSVMFDMHIQDLYTVLLNGGTTVFIPMDQLLNFTQLKQVIAQYGINHLVLPTALLQQLVDIDISIFANIKAVMAGGDVMPLPQINRLVQKYPDLEIINGYGPTETCVYATTQTVKGVQQEAIPIGSPISNTKAYILDAGRSLQPIGIVGEIYIGGDALANGYLSLPDQTNQVFVKDPFANDPEARMYKTGDLGRWNEHGQIEFRGRKDKQVKIRGYRVELEEIQNAIQAHPEVMEAYIMVINKDTVDPELVAYYSTPKPGKQETVNQWITDHLPAYMAPGYLIEMPSIPRNSSLKVDKNRLPDPVTGQQEKQYKAPTTATEKALVQMVKEILSLDKAGVDTNFFEQGGHSLKATQLISRIGKELGVSLELRSIFQYPVLEKLAAHIDNAEATDYSAIPQAPQQRYYPVSHAQRRLWVLHELEPNLTAYHISNIVPLQGAIDVQATQQAFNTLVQRHESLRTTFVIVNGQPYQQIQSLENNGFSVQFTDLEGQEDAQEQAAALVNEVVNKPFNLQTGPLLRVHLIKVNAESSLLALCMHHIISDGWSMNVLTNEVLNAYTALNNGQPVNLPALRIQYKDYTLWQLERVAQESTNRHKQYWLNQFTTKVPVLHLPTDNPRPALKTHNGSYLQAGVNANTRQQLQRMANQQGASMYMVSLAATYALMYQYTGQTDMVLGTPTAGRDHADLEPLIGFMVNTLPLRVQFDATKSFTQLLQQVKEVLLAGQEHQVYPFDLLVEELDGQQDISRSALFDVLVSMQNITGGGQDSAPAQEVEFEEGQAQEVTDKQGSKFDLTFDFTDADHGLFVNLNYNTDLFERQRMEGLLANWAKLLKAIAAYPEVRLDEMDDPLSAQERQQLAQAAQSTPATQQEEAPYAAPETETEKVLVQIWEEVLNRTPIGIDDNFFEKGGHSLKAARMMAHVYKELHVQLALAHIFENPTVRQLAQVVDTLEKTAVVAIEPIANAEHYAVSHAQKRLWLADQLGQGQAAFNIPGTYMFEGALNKDALEKAFNTLIERHEILRTTFISVEGQPRQVVHPAQKQSFKLEYVDLQGQENIEQLVANRMDQDTVKPFKLDQGPLLRVQLLQTAPETHVLIMNMHHIISDGWSMEVLQGEVTTLYQAYKEGQENPLPPLTLQYKDFAAWQNQLLDQAQGSPAYNYWMQRFDGQLPKLMLPTDRTRPAIKTYNGAVMGFQLSQELSQQFMQLSNQKGGSLFMGLLSAYYILLYRLSGQHDLVVGSPIAGRSQAELESQIGIYLNLLALRQQLAPNETVASLLDKVIENTMGAFQHQSYPFDKLVEDLDVERDDSRSPLFDVLLQLQNMQVDDKRGEGLDADNLAVGTLKTDVRLSKYDLTFSFYETEQGMFFNVEYNTDLFDAATIEGLGKAMDAIMEQMVQNPDASIDSLKLPGSDDNEQDDFLKSLTE